MIYSDSERESYGEIELKRRLGIEPDLVRELEQEL